MKPCDWCSQKALGSGGSVTARLRALFVGGVERLGLSFFTPLKHGLPMLNVVNVPEGADDAKVRAALLDRGI